MAPDWAPISVERALAAALPAVAHVLLHGILSGLLHMHLYRTCPPAEDELDGVTAGAPMHAPADEVYDSSPEASHEASCRTLASAGSGMLRSKEAANTLRPELPEACCRHGVPGAELLQQWSFDLNELQLLGPDLAPLDRAGHVPPCLLLLELSDGWFYAYPPLQAADKPVEQNGQALDGQNSSGAASASLPQQVCQFPAYLKGQAWVDEDACLVWSNRFIIPFLPDLGDIRGRPLQDASLLF